MQAMREVPRHLFVAPVVASKAYGPGALPIGANQTISQPYIVARMIELLDLSGKEKVLEVGTGTGYQAVVLSKLAHDGEFWIENTSLPPSESLAVGVKL